MATSDEYFEKAAQMRKLAAAQPKTEYGAEFEQMARGWEAMGRRRQAEDARLTAEPKTGA
jgi:hypothetical protein